MTIYAPTFLDEIEHDARAFRSAYEGLQEGAVDSGDLKVTTGGSGLLVNVAAGVGFVGGDSIPDEGLYRCRSDASVSSAAFTLGAIPAAHATLPRIDQIVARVYNQEADGSGSRLWRLEVVAGTATSGATLANRTGAASLPASAMRLADVLTPAAFAGPYVDATHIRDRRPWARGARFIGSQLSGADYAVSATSFAELDATNLKKRIECSGKPLRVRFQADDQITSALNVALTLRPTVDGASAIGTEGAIGGSNAAGVISNFISFEWVFTPAAGSHLIAVEAKVNSGSVVIQRGTDYGVYFDIEEDLRASAENSGA